MYAVQVDTDRLAQILSSAARELGAKSRPEGGLRAALEKTGGFAGILEAAMHTGLRKEGIAGATATGTAAAPVVSANETAKAIEDNQTLDPSEMNLLQYVMWRTKDSGTSPEDQLLLRNAAGALVMQFAGYAPRGYNNEQIVNWFLAQMHS